jgi:uncharacterized OsmC-like protein
VSYCVRADVEAGGTALSRRVEGSWTVLCFETASPVELMLTALALCMARSLEIVLAARGLTAGRTAFVARAEKARDKPARLIEVEIDVQVGEWLAAGVRERALADAKRLCTVSNTFAPGVRVTLSVPSPAPPATDPAD